MSPLVKKQYGARIREIAPDARLVVPSIREGSLAWSSDPTTADICCFTDDMWHDLASRQLLLPQLFRIEGLRWFHTFSAGVDSPVFKMLIDRGTILTNSSGSSAPAIAEYVLAMMLFRAKDFSAFGEQQRAHDWTQHRGRELSDQTAGIIGTGAIGGNVARLAKAFGMRTVGLRRTGAPARYFDEMLTSRGMRSLLRQSDFLVLACPLTRETEGLIGERELRAMHPTATLINVARGRVVDEAALIEALTEGWIAAACLDVFTVEPLPETSPLWSMPNVFITPHNSGNSPLNMGRSMAIFLDNLARYVKKKPMRNRVTDVGR